MDKKIRKKRYFSTKSRLNVAIAIATITLCMVTAVITVAIVYSKKQPATKSIQASTEQNNDISFQNFLKDFESNPDNQTRDLSGVISVLNNALGTVLKRALPINNATLELQSSVGGYTQIQAEVESSGGVLLISSLGTLLHIWALMERLDIGEARNLFKAGYEGHILEIEAKLINDLRDYKLRIIMLEGLSIRYRVEYGDEAKNNVLFSHTIAFIKAFETKLFPISINIIIEKGYFSTWQGVKENKQALVFLNQFGSVVLGLPLFMIFNFVTDPKTREMINNNKLNYGKYKELLGRILNTEGLTKEQLDDIKDKFYKLFSLLELQGTHNGAIEEGLGSIDAIGKLMKLLDDDLEMFLKVYNK